MSAPTQVPSLDHPVIPQSASLLQVRDLIYQVAGIFHPDNKLRLLEERCLRRMKALNLTTLKEYCGRLTGKPLSHAEMVNLLNEITIGETYFFRNEPQLKALKNVLLTRIFEAKTRISSRHLRIWSAGCSTGEEPYTLSMLLLEELSGKLKGWTFEIIATDLNENSIQHCKQGVYRDYSTRNLPQLFKGRYFLPLGEALQVHSTVKSKVAFSRVNLLDDKRMSTLKGMDVIVCCNVLIYFDIASKRRVIQNFYDSLLPHGYLFLGHAESLYGVNDEFHLVHLPSATAYVKTASP